MDVANLDEVDPQWVATHASWIYSDDHRWDRDRARKTLPTMIGLASAPEPDESGDESLSDYVAKCNAEAERFGAELRLHEVALDGDAYVFVALPPRAFATLVKDGCLEVD